MVILYSAATALPTIPARMTGSDELVDVEEEEEEVVVEEVEEVEKNVRERVASAVKDDASDGKA